MSVVIFSARALYEREGWIRVGEGRERGRGGLDLRFAVGEGLDDGVEDGGAGGGARES